ncbi:MAG: TGS domain-containing protein [Planctomycetota bacterium]
MPANLTPQYLKAEQAFKEAKTVEDKIAALEEMLALLPKHKGTDHLQADLRRRLSKLREEAAKPKGGKKGFDPFRVEKGGAGQVLFLGPPNCGKSALVARLSGAPTGPAPFPFATQGPIPGMMPFEDAQVQIVDLPPVAAGHTPKGMLGLVKSADGLVLVADLDAETILDDFETVLRYLEEGRVAAVDPAIPESERAPDPEPEADSPKFLRKVRLPAVLLANKSDAPGALEKLELLREFSQGRFGPIAVSASTGEGLDAVPGRVFAMLDCIRIYSKEPGKPPDLAVPFVLKRGATILDLAAKIHRDFPEHLRQARVWGSARFGGQAVSKDYVLADKDVVELHVDV